MTEGGEGGRGGGGSKVGGTVGCLKKATQDLDTDGEPVGIQWGERRPRKYV